MKEEVTTAPFDAAPCRENVASPAGNEEVFFPVSFAQQRLWFLDQLEPNSPAYNIPVGARLRGKFQLPTLHRALEMLVRRHEPLRTSYRMINGEPVQVIAPPGKLEMPVVDLSRLPQADRQREAEQLMKQEALKPFNLEQDLKLRVCLLRLSADEHILVTVMHHIASDGWSVGIFYEELGLLLQSLDLEQSCPLPDLPMTYAVYAKAQRQSLQGKELARQLQYWKKQLAGMPPLLELPSDRPRPAAPYSRGGVQTVSLSLATTESLRALARQQNCTLFMLLLGALQALLHRYTGQESFGIGSPIANRENAKVEGLIGCFINMLVLRADVSGNPTFRELLRRVQGTTLDAYEHQSMPFAKLVAELQPERNQSISPLFQVSLALENTPVSRERYGELEIEPFYIDNSTAQYDLCFYLRETSQGLTGEIIYARDLFDEWRMARLAGHLQVLLEGVIANPDQRISDLPLLTGVERRQLLVEWNHTRVPCPREQSITQLFEAQVERTPDAVAAVFQGAQLTYRQLNQRANQLALHLQALGVGPDVLVGICAERSLEMLIGPLAILKAGGAYVPLDPSFPKDRLAFMAQDAELKVLLTQEKFAADINLPQTKIVCLDQFEFDPQTPVENPPSRFNPDNLAYVMFTSGSTGQPKGVMIMHRNVVNFFTGMDAVIGADPGVWLAVTTISFDISVLELFWTICRGFKVVIQTDIRGSRASARPGKPGNAAATDDFSICAEIHRHGVTHFQCTPSLMGALVQDPESLAAVRTLKKVLMGGEALPAALLQQLEIAGQVINVYGPTETTVWSTAWPVDRSRGSISIGRPIANTEIYILDAQGQPVPAGMPGELFIGGEGVARGYLKRPELTAERFIPNPFSAEPGARLYRTGDLARWLPDGTIDFIGRADFQVKIRGFRIELGEIEAVLARHPGVRQCVVVARTQTTGAKHLVAYIVPAQTPAPSSADLQTFMSQRLPDYMQPTLYVPLDALPTTPNGKVDRKALPAPSQAGPEQRLVLPQSPAEKILAGIWKEVLRVPQIGIHDNFFQLGGDSILTILAVSKANQAGIRLTPKLLFQHQTIAELARVVEVNPDAMTAPALEAQAASPLVEIKQALKDRLARKYPGFEDVYPLAPMQQLFLALAGGQSAVGHEQYWFALQGPLDHAAFRQAWQQVVERHAIFRTAFVTEETDEPLQLVVPKMEVRCEYHDWRGLSEVQQSQRLQAFLRVDLQRGFDVAQPPLMRLALLQTADHAHYFVWSYHHLLLDGWSVPMILQEVAHHYGPLRQGQPANLEPARSYRDFIAWLQARDWAAAEKFWSQTLAGYSAPHLITGAKRKPLLDQNEAVSGEKQITLDAKTTARLQSWAREHQLTLNNLLEAAWALILSRVSGAQDVVFGATVSGRPAELPGVESMVGMFINNVPRRVKIAPEDSLLPWLKRLRAQQVDMQEYEFASLLQIQRWSGLPWHARLFESLTVFQNYQGEEGPLQLAPGLRMEEIQSTLRTNYPVTLVGIPGAELCVKIIYDARLLEPAAAGKYLAGLQALLEAMAANPEQKAAQLLRALDPAFGPGLPSPAKAANGAVPHNRKVVPPRNELECHLTQIWERVLGVKPIGITDNFFDLGGHSLPAVWLFEEIRKAYGKHLPMVTLFQAPTVEQLALVLQQDSWSAAWSSLVPIKASGTKPPFYCVHGVGGNILEYLDLAKYMDEDQPFYGLQAVGLDGKRPRLQTVEEMAAHYISEIKRFQPEGPYHLGGSSFGGLVAYEMAQQLHAQGDEVAVLAFFDTWAPGYLTTLPKTTWVQRKLNRFQYRLRLHWSNLKASEPGERWNYLRGKALKWQRGKVTQLKELRQRWKQRMAEQSLPDEIRETRNAGYRASYSYTPVPYPGRATLFRATIQRESLRPDPFLGWGDLVQGGIEVYDTPGHHGSIVRDPRAKTLAEQLKDCLRKSRQDGSLVPESQRLVQTP